MGEQWTQAREETQRVTSCFRFRECCKTRHLEEETEMIPCAAVVAHSLLLYLKRREATMMQPVQVRTKETFNRTEASLRVMRNFYISFEHTDK